MTDLIFPDKRGISVRCLTIAVLLLVLCLLFGACDATLSTSRRQQFPSPNYKTDLSNGAKNAMSTSVEGEHTMVSDQREYLNFGKLKVLPRGGQTTTQSSSFSLFRSSRIPLTRPLAVAYGIVLAFNSGYLNGLTLSGTFFGTKQATAAMTGSYTNSAVGAALDNWSAVALQLKVLSGYIFGATIAGSLNPRPEPFVVKALAIGLSFAIAAAALVLAATLFSDSNPMSDGISSDWFFALVALANGLQNSVTSAHTANLVRSTHYTGISSDIGTFLGQIVRGNTENLFKLKIFVGLGASFWLGGYLAVLSSNKQNGLWVSARLYVILAAVLMYQDWRLRELQTTKSHNAGVTTQQAKAV